MTEPLRFLLDQNFPNPPHGLAFDILDKSVVLEHFGTRFRDHAVVSTPDWKVYLLAKAAGFSAVVTSDENQLGEDREMVALRATRLGLITWHGGQADPVVLYGQLLAYLPQIVKRLSERPGTVVVLPRGHLRPDVFMKADDIMRRRDQRDQLSLPERVGLETTAMRSELEGTADEALAELL